MNFFHSRKIDIFIGALTLALFGCEPQNVREEKALRRQFVREMQNHSYESAIPIARELIKRDPNSSRHWRLLVRAQMRLRDYDGAKQTLSEWSGAVKPAPIRIEEFEGDIARDEHDIERALQAWRHAAADQPKRRRVHEKIANAEQKQGHWREAIEEWTNALKVKDNANARINRAVCYRRLRDWDNAFSDLRHAQKLAPNDQRVQHWSQTFDNIAKYLDELRELEAKLAALPGDVGLLGDSALLLLRCGDAELALEQAETATRLAPWAMRPKLLQALALIGLGRAKECDRLSIKQPFRLESLTPDFLEVLSRLDSAISVERKNPDHFIARAWQLNEIAQPLLALQDAEKAVELDPKSAGALAELSYALTKVGRGNEALEKIKSATELDPSLVSAWQYRGELEM